MFVAVASVLMIDAMAYGVVVPFLPQRARQLGGSPIEIATVFSAYAFGLLLVTIPAGVVSDRWGRPRIIVAGGLGMALATLAFAFSDALWLLGLTRFLQGVTGALWWSPSLALLADSYPPDRRGGRLGMAMSVTGIGALIGPLFGGVLTQLATFRLPLLIIAAGCLATAAAFGLMSRGLPVPGSRGRGRPLRAVLFDRLVLLVCGTALLTTLGLGMLEPLLPLHLADTFAAGPAAIGAVFSVAVIGWTVASTLAGRLSDRIGRRAPIIAGVLGTAVMTPLTVFVGSLWLVGLVIFLAGVTQAAMEAPALPLLAERVEGAGAPDETRFGAVYALFDTSFALGGLIGPLIGGALLEVTTLRVALSAYGVLLLAYLPFLAAGLRTHARTGGNAAGL